MKDVLGKEVRAGDRIVVMPDYEHEREEAKPWFAWIHRIEPRTNVFQGKPGAYVYDGPKGVDPVASDAVTRIAWLRSKQFVKVKP